MQRGKALGDGALRHRTEVGFLKQLHLVLRRKFRGRPWRSIQKQQARQQQKQQPRQQQQQQQQQQEQEQEQEQEQQEVVN